MALNINSPAEALAAVNQNASLMPPPTTTKYFAYSSDDDNGPMEMIHLAVRAVPTWLAAADDAMRTNGYAYICRQIEAHDLPVNVYSEVDESRYKIGDYGLWVRPTQHRIHAAAPYEYSPIGVEHPHFTSITGDTVEACLRQYTAAYKGYSHPKHHIKVAEAVFDADNQLVELEGRNTDFLFITCADKCADASATHKDNDSPSP